LSYPAISRSGRICISTCINIGGIKFVSSLQSHFHSFIRNPNSETIVAFRILSVANAHFLHASSWKIPYAHNLLICSAKQTPCNQVPKENRLEFVELLDSLSSTGKHAENIESDLGKMLVMLLKSLQSKSLQICLMPSTRDWVTYGLAQWSALSNGNLVTLLNTESRGNVRSQVLVSLLVSGVLGDEVEVFSADDEGTVHLGGNDGAGQDTTTDGDETSEGALLVCGERELAFHSASAHFRIQLRARVACLGQSSMVPPERKSIPISPKNDPFQTQKSHIPM
jgi:hypothetical protein